MSYQGNLMIEQDRADALWNMGEAEWREVMRLANEDQEKILKKAKELEKNE